MYNNKANCVCFMATDNAIIENVYKISTQPGS